MPVIDFFLTLELLLVAVTLTAYVVWPVAYRRGIQRGRETERFSRDGGIVTYE